jgi:hypothetical protein
MWAGLATEDKHIYGTVITEQKIKQNGEESYFRS